MSTETRKENYNVKQNRYSRGKKNNSNQFVKASFNTQSRTGNGFSQKGKKSYKKKPYVKNGAQKAVRKPSVKIAFLGGLNEIGKNITLIECENDIIIVDCGMAFPDGDMLGVDLVIPDFSYIEQNYERVKEIGRAHV